MTRTKITLLVIAASLALALPVQEGNTAPLNAAGALKQIASGSGLIRQDGGAGAATHSCSWIRPPEYPGAWGMFEPLILQ